MKSVKITYHCDYCKQVIDQGVDIVCTLHPGRIGSKDAEIRDPDDRVHHYHDYCMEKLLCLQPKDVKVKPNEPDQHEPEGGIPHQEQEPEAEAEPDPKTRKETASSSTMLKGTYSGPVKPGAKDLPALKAMLDAGWSQKKCAEEFCVAQSTISKWVSDIRSMIDAGTWEEYCRNGGNRE